MAIGGSPAGAPRAKDGSKGSAGRFTFVAEVARGYLGSLWLARDAADSSEGGTVYTRHVTPLVAASARAAILEGARWSIAGAESPIFQVFEGRTALDLVTPFIDGEVLRSLLRTAAVKHTTMEPALTLGLARELVDQLESVHERGLSTKSPHAFGGVHPDSVLVDLTGRVHLLDVGAGAAASAREPWRSDPQRIGYFAPEQTEGRGAADARTDVFAVGILLWEALANRRLFPGNDAKTTRERVQKGPIGRLDATRSTASPGIATDIADVVARCLERNPDARFQSLEELRGALDELDLADATRIGAWVTSLADVAIAKRHQFLERAVSQPASVFPRHDSVSAPPPSVRPRPSSSVPPISDDRPTSPNPAQDTRAAPPASLPRPPSTIPTATPRATSASSPPRAPSAAATPPARPVSSTPRPPSTATPAPSPAAAPPRPPSATATPHPAAATAAKPPAASHTPAPVPARAAPPSPPSASATPLPPSRRSVPPRPHSVAEPPQAEEPVPAPRAPADSAEAIEPIEDETDAAEEDTAEEDAADDAAIENDDGESEAVPAPQHSKPPPLPHAAHPEAVAAVAPLPEAPAKPIHTTELASLTAPPAPSSSVGKRAAIAAVILAVGVGGLLIGRSKPRPSPAPVPNAQRTVQTPPIQIAEALSAVVPQGSAAPPSAAPEASAVPEPSARPAASAESAHPSTPEGTPAATPEASAAKVASGDKPSTPKPRAATETTHHASSSQGTPSSGFKPGGI